MLRRQNPPHAMTSVLEDGGWNRATEPGQSFWARRGWTASWEGLVGSSTQHTSAWVISSLWWLQFISPWEWLPTFYPQLQILLVLQIHYPLPSQHFSLGSNQIGLHSAMSNRVWKSVQFSRSVMSDSLQPQGLQHARPPCPSPTPGTCSDSCPSGWWCYPTISSSVIHFSSCLQSFPASGSFQMSKLFASGGQSIGVSASTPVLPMNMQDWSPLGWTI